MAKVTIDNMADAINKIIADYGEEAQKGTAEVVKKVTEVGVKALRGNPGSFGGTGKYSKGWRSQYETQRLSAQGTIYNATVPGLPHLLENGHAKRGGGRVPGRVHIKPVEDQIIETFTKQLEEKL